MNLFLNTRKLTQSKEDHLTEFVAGALNISNKFRSGYETIVLNEFALKQNWSKPRIKEIKTQVSFENSNCRPDLFLSLDDGHQIICEHKIDASETIGSEYDKREQLRRYLDLSIDGVAYFRDNFKDLHPSVLHNPKYIKPKVNEHFLWRDLYKATESVRNKFIIDLREAFEKLGYTPPLPIIGDLNSPQKIEREANRKNFAKFWTPIISLCRKKGWYVERGSIVELYVKLPDNNDVTWIFISPANSQRFLIRFTLKNEENNLSFVDKLKTIADNTDDSSEIEVNKVNRTDGVIDVIEIKSSLYSILGNDYNTVKDIEDRLYNYIAKFLNLI